MIVFSVIVKVSNVNSRSLYKLRLLFFEKVCYNDKKESECVCAYIIGSWPS